MRPPVSLCCCDPGAHSYCRISLVSGDYHHTISKKKECTAVEGEEKLLSIDALGIVMVKGKAE